MGTKRKIQSEITPLYDYLDEATEKGLISISTVVLDWINLSAYTMAYLNGANSGHSVEIYQRICDLKNKYSEKQLSLFVKALQVLGELHEKETKDWLGQLTGFVSLTENKTGQVFTPDYVARLMSELNNTRSSVSETVSDPCCGTGSLLLGHINRVRERNNREKINIHACDLDRTALLCTFIQCGLHGVNGVFEVGNSMLNEVYETFYSTPFILSWYINSSHKLNNIDR